MNWMIRHKDDATAWWHAQYGWTTFDKASVFSSNEKEAYVDGPRNGIWKRRFPR